ncbi:uncharacterized protein A4U43_C06F2330 [Asparagus officinalis]|uniref:SURP motif domain-containing protein n=1 Tax=Asparagus officinalis TaxID=4686 RepID=A0A5P1EIX5_ASPOF|nr:uncharacterized protein A4U43_C06F2330 [Asparagus officinalis]
MNMQQQWLLLSSNKLVFNNSSTLVSTPNPSSLSRSKAHPSCPLTPQCSNFPSPPPFMHPFDSPPPPAMPPSDPELHKIIDKLAEYAAKNGPEFEAMIREKQKDNPDYSFLFGGEGHNYYRYKLWLFTRPPGPAVNPSFPPASMLASPPLHQPHLHQPPPHLQPFLGQGRADYDSSTMGFKGLSGPLPSDVAVELNGVLSNLTGTKESIKGAKMWFMQRSPFAPALAEALRERIFALDDPERQLHIIFLANDILFDSLQRRVNPQDLDNEALAFRPVLGSMLSRIYNNPHNKEANQSRLEKILHFWASKEVYDQATIDSLESEMTGRLPLHPAAQTAMSAASDPMMFAGQQPPLQWQQPEKQNSASSSAIQQDTQKSLPPASHFTSTIPPSGIYPPVAPSITQPPKVLENRKLEVEFHTPP